MTMVRRRAVLASGIGTTLSLPAIVEAQADWPRGPACRGRSPSA